MQGNSYTGVVGPNIPNLIHRRACCYRVSRDDIGDLQQQIVPLLAKFQFDPQRAGGASVTTAMTAVINKQIFSHLRAERRRAKRMEQMKQTASTAPADPRERVDALDLRLDVEAALARLSRLDQRVCQALREGQNQLAIARQLGITRSKLQCAILRIRRVFQQVGLDAWLGREPASRGGLADAENSGEQR